MELVQSWADKVPWFFEKHSAVSSISSNCFIADYINAYLFNQKLATNPTQARTPSQPSGPPGNSFNQQVTKY